MDINATLIGQLLSLALFVWFCMKFVWPPITAALAQRQQKIEAGLNAAEKAQQSLNDAQAQVAQEMTEAKKKAAELIEQANKRAVLMIEEAKHQAQIEAARVKAAADAELELEVGRARDALRAQVAELAVTGASKILGREVDAARHAAMLAELAEQL